jgi:spectinomycin phosphotransferase
MKSRPPGVSDAQLGEVLASGWGLRGLPLRYAPVGAGSYHWTAGRFFVTVDDLSAKPWLGSDRSSVLDGLRTAMEVAGALATLPFVVAPVNGTVCPLGDRYAVTVFPYLDGVPGEWGAHRDARERAEVLDMLAALHNAPAGKTVPSRPVALPGRAALEAALDRPAFSGPYAAEVRALITESGPLISDLLATFDRLVRATAGLPTVITHGEPHPGNVIRTATGLVLIDWDTVGLAPPERDLWFLAASDSAQPGDSARDGDSVRDGDFSGYQAATGYRPSPEAIDLYRLRWQLDDICAYLTELRQAPHPTEDTAHALRTLQALTQHP